VNLHIIGAAAILIISFIGHAWAATSTEIYDRLEATITTPDSVPAGTNFDVYVEGQIISGGSTDIYAYYLYEDAEWYYDTTHRVVFTSGTLVHEDRFNWGYTYSNTYVLNRPPGVYKYTYVFGFRTSMHGWYDVAVETEVESLGEIPAESPLLLFAGLGCFTLLLIKVRPA
jgi:hypothetical protein